MAKPVPNAPSHCFPATTLNFKPSLLPRRMPTTKELCKNGNLKQAFHSFSHLFLSNSLPLTSFSSYFPLQDAYSSLLDLCASQAALFEGRQVHARIITSSCVALDHDFLSTKLAFMYGKCGSLSDARLLFDNMSHRSVFAWNALLGAYASSGRALEALELYKEMRVSGAFVDSCTLPLVLKACGMLRDLDLGREVHGLAVKSGFSTVYFVVNALIAMYAKSGGFAEGMTLFNWLSENGGADIVSWNSIILAHLQNSLYFETLDLFRDMQKAGVFMNSYTVVGTLQASAELSLLKLGMEIHASLLKSVFCELHLFEANALVVMYSKCGRLDYAIEIFKGMGMKDHISWNSMLSAYVQNGFYHEALDFFSGMQAAGYRPDQVSVMSIISVSGRLENLSNGMECHAFAIKHGFDSDIQVGNTLLDMYSKCSYVAYAKRVFSMMPTRDFITWTTILAGFAENHYYLEALDLLRKVEMEGMKADPMMIGSILLVLSGLKHVLYVKEIHCYIIRHGLFDSILENSLIDVYGECGKIDAARKLFERMDNKDVISWTGMISCYICNGLADEALHLFHDMIKAGVEPDSVSLNTALSAASGLSSLRKGKELHGFLIRHCFLSDGSVGSALVDMYSRCGAVNMSLKLFNWIRCKDLVLWTSMINAYGMHGQGQEAIKLFEYMEETGLVPDHITFLALLYACSHSGLIEKGKNYLNVMKYRYQLEPWPEHYACVVDLLGRSNCLNEAYEFIMSMPTAPTSALWCALLGACQIHSNNYLGEIAAQKLLELEPENPGNYVLVSNFFAAKENWKDVDVVRMRMKEKGLTKIPACSWMEVRNKVHSFTARDTSHPQTTEIYDKLDKITDLLERESGYIADTKFVLHNLSEEEKKRMLYGHSERLAIAFGLISTSQGTTIRITKNLRVCGDCHQFTKLVSKLFQREIVVRDSNRFHHFSGGVCSCGDFW